jgi:hypothetical protein
VTALNTEASLFDADDLTAAVYQAVGAASVCWSDMTGTGTFREDRARHVAEELLSYIRLRMDPDALALVFKAAWHRADRQGLKGQRTDAGIAAVTRELFGADDDDPDQLALFDCGD